MDLYARLMDELGLSREQAEGAAGAVLQLAQARIPADDFVRVADTITKMSSNDSGLVIVAASHGGVYPGYLTAAGRCRGVILNDAGLGFDQGKIIDVVVGGFGETTQ